MCKLRRLQDCVFQGVGPRRVLQVAIGSLSERRHDIKPLALHDSSSHEHDPVRWNDRVTAGSYSQFFDDLSIFIVHARSIP